MQKILTIREETLGKLMFKLNCSPTDDDDHEFLGILNLSQQKNGSGKLKLAPKSGTAVLAFLAPFWGGRFKIPRNSLCHKVSP